MVQVRNITMSEEPPQGEDWILVEADGHLFRAHGSVQLEGDGANGAEVFAPLLFETVEAAVDASVKWAQTNRVPVVYVRAVD